MERRSEVVRKIGLVFSVDVYGYFSERTSDLRVGGSNPSGRAKDSVMIIPPHFPIYPSIASPLQAPASLIPLDSETPGHSQAAEAPQYRGYGDTRIYS
jgi:hypothetical protein